jgi:hypothetical protein
MYLDNCNLEKQKIMDNVQLEEWQITLLMMCALGRTVNGTADNVQFGRMANWTPENMQFLILNCHCHSTISPETVAEWYV